ncbi:kinase-like domain-containing protein [Lineolata rhizophorae]|uniref:Kinase-like domain-containing protein n=1 Tax=Lineolata rhizophorae TaxID=578093 RepID=A0A6A6NNZ1_9PEZI|nr:kinase-like domain-containing protein [Lineolata rhizophorae]
MLDPNVFAVLTPCDEKNRARTAFSLPENADRFHKAVGGVAEEPTIDSRQSTPSLLSPSEETGGEDEDATDRIILTFDKPSKDPLKGWQFGTNKASSDVLLGHRGTRGISGRQFNIAVDERLWVFLHDYHSSHGTAVSYNHKNKDEVRKKETWILSRGPGKSTPWKVVMIHVGHMAIKIEFPNQQAGKPEYMENLRAFFNRSQSALPLLEKIDFESYPSTATPSQPQTPRHQAIYLDDEMIGHGEFGEVRRVIKARDGLYYAAKTFTPLFKDSDGDQKRKRDEEQWRDQIRNEIDIMRNNPHPNVMPVVEFRFTPNPFLVMPYYRDGHLTRHLRHLNEKQYVSALRQILLGLRHLHERGIIHRDLKPENLLVDIDKDTKEITIVIADFGFSKDATPTNDLLKTFCGSLLYAAPDIFFGRSDGYGAKVDIWSAGVIVFGMYGLPEAPPSPWKKEARQQAVALENWISTWTQSLLDKLDDANENDDKVVNMLLHMIDPDPEKRYSAHECLQMGCRNGLFRATRDGRIVDADADDMADNTMHAHPTLTRDGEETPPPQSPRLPETGADNTTFIARNLRGGVRCSGEDSVNSPSDMKDSGRRTRRRRTSGTSSWSLTIGPSNSDSDGGFSMADSEPRLNEGPMTGLFIRRDRFTGSLVSRQPHGDESGGQLEEEQDGGAVTPRPEPVIAATAHLASFERRLFESLAP